MTVDEIKTGLSSLEPGIPWAHHFDLGHGIQAVEPANEKYFKKAVGLKKRAHLILHLIPYHTRRGSAQGLRVLDLACGEGCHSVESNALLEELDQLYNLSRLHAASGVPVSSRPRLYCSLENESIS
jgi:hypothetical protein